ncbi:response regulator [Cohnella silvisoli]|uniref:Response regulator n=1 Tax=Cohnella silvisoli TaxID=2873699 RepID=A0ABV1L2P2_9BACL|nr:response regulator [Cohnella silvisoli]MCD9021616.1 response regulator [Cohnella silvisoli]
MYSILIVDDNPSDRLGITKLMDWDALGIRVVGSAFDGQDGYEKAVQLRPDIILTDISMPRMDGIEMTRLLQERLPDTKFIFMSCHDDFSYLKVAIDLRVNGYALKPIEIADLYRDLDKVRKTIQSELDQEQRELQQRNQLDQSLPVLRERYVKELLYANGNGGYGDSACNPAAIAEKCTECGMNLSNQSYRVVIVQIDHYDLSLGQGDTEENTQLIEQVKRYVQETLSGQLQSYSAVLSNNRLAVLLLMPPENDPEQLALRERKIKDLAQACKETINEQVGIAITIGISGSTDRLDKLPDLLEAAESAVKTKFFSTGNRVILASDEPAPLVEDGFSPAELKLKVQSVVKCGEEQDVHALIAEYFQAERPYSRLYIKSIAYSMLHALQGILVEMDKDAENTLWRDITAWDTLVRLETMEDIRLWLSDKMNSVRAFIRRSDHGGRNQRIVEDIKSIIDAGYGHLENVAQTVESLHISASHANLIFKQYTGQTIFDYLIQRKMEAAKQLLLNPYVKIYEVAEKTGYKTHSYFAALFKEYTGVTPMQYKTRNSG